MSEKYTSIIRQLQDAETYLVAVRSGSFAPDTISNISKAIDYLKESAYFMRQYPDTAQLRKNYRFQKLDDEFEALVARVVKIVKEGRTSVVASVLTSAQKFQSDLMKIAESESEILSEDVKLELSQLRARVDEYQTVITDMQNAKEEAIAEVRSAQVSHEWAQTYDIYVKPLVISKKDGNKTKKIRIWLSRLFYWGDSFPELERKWAQWRAIWLSVLFVMFAGYLLWAATNVDNLANFKEMIASKLVFLPTVIVLSICFAFASRNYRIHANLLAEYRHRRTVASIMENLVLNTALQDKDELKLEMIREGAKAMFSMKNVGHLGKDTVEKVSIIDVIKEIKR